MKRAALAGLLAALLGAPIRPGAAAPPPPETVSLSHAFGSAPADGPDVELVLEERQGSVRRGGASGRELLDSTDYSSVAELVVARELLLGPSDPPVTLPPGLYECDLLPAEPGRLRLVLRGQDGLRLSLPLGPMPPEEQAPTRHATASAFAQPGEAWVVALRLPTAAGALVLTPSGEQTAPRTPTDAIRKGLRDRLLHGTRPVRRVPR